MKSLTRRHSGTEDTEEGEGKGEGWREITRLRATNMLHPIIGNIKKNEEGRMKKEE